MENRNKTNDLKPIVGNPSPAWKCIGKLPYLISPRKTAELSGMVENATRMQLKPFAFILVNKSAVLLLDEGNYSEYIYRNIYCMPKLLCQTYW